MNVTIAIHEWLLAKCVNYRRSEIRFRLFHGLLTTIALKVMILMPISLCSPAATLTLKTVPVESFEALLCTVIWTLVFKPLTILLLRSHGLATFAKDVGIMFMQMIYFQKLRLEYSAENRSETAIPITLEYSPFESHSPPSRLFGACLYMAVTKTSPAFSHSRSTLNPR